MVSLGMFSHSSFVIRALVDSAYTWEFRDKAIEFTLGGMPINRRTQ